MGSGSRNDHLRVVRDRPLRRYNLGEPERIERSLRVASYIRVSLDCPVDEVLDDYAQDEAIRAWARAHDHRLTVFVEPPNTGSEIGSRVALGDALRAVHDGALGGLVVARLDRLVPEVVIQELLRADIKRAGGELYCADARDAVELSETPADPARSLMRSILATIPEFNLSLRDLFVRQRIRKQFPGGEEAAMAAIESLADQGFSARDITFVMSSEGFRPKLRHVLRRLMMASAPKQ